MSLVLIGVWAFFWRVEAQKQGTPSREVVKFPAEFPELKQPTGGVLRFHHRSHVAFIRFREEKMEIFAGWIIIWYIYLQFTIHIQQM